MQPAALSSLRSSAVQAGGIRSKSTAEALEGGTIARSADATFHLADASPTAELAALASAGARMRKGVACLVSAAYLCGLTDQLRRPIWIALPLRMHEARPGEVPQRVLRWSFSGAFDTGIEESEVCGTLIRHTGAARTILDLIRYARHLRGPEIGIEAARRYVADGRSFEDVLAMASQLKPPKEAVGILSVLAAVLKDPPLSSAVNAQPR
jgi:hypothetical protein